jgi:small-conductance mechanosensitive channel
LLFLLFSPAGIANAVLGVLAFVGLQIAVFTLDSRRSNGSARRLDAKGLGYPVWVFLILLVFLVLYTFAYPLLSYGTYYGSWQALAFWLAMVPFLNGVVLVGFLPNFLLSCRWGQRTGRS